VLVSVGDVRLFVDIDGASLVPDGMSMRERPTIVLLHGTGGDHTSFKQNYAALTDVAQVVYYDQRGNGRSEDGSRDRWTLDQWADDLRALCEVLGIERPVVLGVSFGGVVALNYALRHPDHPAKLVLVSAAARVNVARSLAMYDRLGGPDVRRVAERFFADPVGIRQEYRRVCGPYLSPDPTDPEISARVTVRPEVSEHFLGGEFLRFDLSSRLDQIRCPVLVLNGERDPIVTVEDAEELAAALSAADVRFARFPNAGHGLVGEHEAVLEIVREFVLDQPV
jgi:proline iminopeptidase